MPEAKHQLAAIMFTDIVGYTALMGKDEQKALALLKKNKEIHVRLIAQYNGKLLKEIGDGILAIFSLVSEAVFCAGAIQKAAKEEEIKLKIGIHEGEVILQDNDVFGDGVNIASRIQAEAEEGITMVSYSVYKDVRNKHGIEAEFVGDRQLKNVEEPIKLYNIKIAVINSEDIDAEPETRFVKFKPKSKTLFASIGIAMAILAGWWFWPTFNQSESAISQSLIDSRIAIIPFKNNTGDPSYDFLGDMSSEWITKALMETKKVKVVLPNSTQTYIKYANVFPTQDQQVNFRRLTGADHLIIGSFYLEKDELIVSSQIINTKDGSVEYSFVNFRGNKSMPSSLLDNVKNKIAGYWLSQDEVLKSKFHVPSKEAWLEFLKGRKAWDGDSAKTFIENVKIASTHFSNAIELDSTFMLAWLHLVMSYQNIYGDCNEKVSKMQSKLEAKRDLMTEYEWNLFQLDKHRFTGNWTQAHKYAMLVYEVDPMSIRENFLAGLTANEINMPAMAIQIHEKIPLELVPDHTDKSNIIFSLASAYEKVGNYDKLLEVISHKSYSWISPFYKTLVYSARNDIANMKEVLKNNKNISLANLGWKNEVDGKTELAEMIYQAGLDISKSPLEKSFYMYQLKYYDEAEEILEKELEKIDLNNRSIPMYYLAMCYAKNKSIAKAVKIVEQLQKIVKECESDTLPMYSIACIYAALNDKDSALKWLREMEYIGDSFENPTLYQLLKNEPEYEEMIRIKG